MRNATFITEIPKDSLLAVGERGIIVAHPEHGAMMMLFIDNVLRPIDTSQGTIMENQHQHIKGYRDLTQEEIDLMNRIKEHGEQTRKLIGEVNRHVERQCNATVALPPIDNSPGVRTRTDAQEAEYNRLAEAEPFYWLSLARSDLQKGIMALVRAVAQPTSF